MSRPLRAALASALLLVGCIDLRVTYQGTPSAASFDSIRPQRTTRAEVLRLLGPPDEVRQPGLGEALRRIDARQLRIEAGEVFTDEAWTWASERWTERIVGLLPVGVVLFRVRSSRSVERRWRIEFDDDGVVRSVSHVDELD